MQRNRGISLLRRRIRMRDNYQLPQLKLKNDAAMKIQRWFKIRQWRRRPRTTLGQSATMIQKVWRGRTGRKLAKIEQDELNNAAAMAIQEVFRNYRAAQHRRREAMMTECPICIERVGIFNSIELKCGHKICTRCTRELIEHSVANAQTDIPIKCPFSSERCEEIFSCTFPNAFSLCTIETFRKWERWEIMKVHIPDKNISHCPFPSCGLPYDASEFEHLSRDNNISESELYRFRVYCPECMSLFCARCNNIWESNHRCRTLIQQITQPNPGENSVVDNETTSYLQQQCKECPNCRAIVQKTKTNDQITYEQRTGLSGGTEDCHHMTCTSCKTDFCWTCMELYRGTSYYHMSCPISDCVISFHQDIPRIIRLPISVNTIRIEIIDNDRMDIPNVAWYSTSGTRSVTHSNDIAPQNYSAWVTCDKDGVVKSLRGVKGEYTFRQENKRVNEGILNPTSPPINTPPRSATLMEYDNRNRVINRNLEGLLANNRVQPPPAPIQRGRLDNRTQSNPTRRPATPIQQRMSRIDASLNELRRIPRRPSPTRPLRPPTPPRLLHNPPRSATELLERFNRRNI